MTPEEIRSLIPQYLAGQLNAAEQQSFSECMANDPSLNAEVTELEILWRDLGLLPAPEPSARLRARFYQELNAHVNPKPMAVPARAWWKRAFVPQLLAACAVFGLGIGVGRLHRPDREPPSDVAQLQTQVDGLRRTVALSLMDKQSATSRLEGVSWVGQVDKPDQELLTALTTTLNHDPNINVRLASLDALEKFTSDATVRKALEQSIPTQQSPLVQIALIDALVHIRDNAAAQEFKRISGDKAIDAAVRQRAQWGLQKLSYE